MLQRLSRALRFPFSLAAPKDGKRKVGVVAVRRLRIIIGTAISMLAVGVVFPVAYWFIARRLDAAFGSTAQWTNQAVTYILTGITWSLGLFWMLWAYSYLVFVGGGSPVEILAPTQQLTTAGPYAYVRNPLVFGMLLALLGVAILANSVCGIILLPIVGLFIAGFLRFVEEPSLLRRFGTGYEHYREHVPMLVPRPKPYVPPEGSR